VRQTMGINELKKQFLVDEDTVKQQLEQLLTKALQHCVVDKKGTVHIKDAKMSGADKFRLVLSAPYLASQLDSTVSAAVTTAEVGISAGLPTAQVRARAKDAVDSKFAEPVSRGVFRAMPHKIGSFLDSLIRDSTKK